MKKNVICLFIALLPLLLLNLTGCNSNVTKNKSVSSYLNTKSEFPIVDQKIELSITVLKRANSGSVDKIWFWKFIQEKTNIKFNITQIDDSALMEKKNLMFAVNELPDILYGLGLRTTDIVKYGVVNKQLAELSELIENNAPDIKSAFEQYPTAKQSVKAYDGKIYSLPYIAGDPKNSFSYYRSWINKKWLDNLKLPMPTNLDELYTVLKAFKEKDPNGNGKADEIPLGGTWRDLSPAPIILASLGFITDPTAYYSLSPAIRNGKAVIPAGDPAYKEYLTYMNKLYSEGLLDRDIFVNSTTAFSSKASEDRVGIHMATPFTISPNKWRDFDSLPPLVSNFNAEKMWAGPIKEEPGAFAISEKCKYKEAAIRFANYFFTMEGSLYTWFGPQKGTTDTLGVVGGWDASDTGEIKYDYPQGVSNTYDYILGYIAPMDGNRVGIGRECIGVENRIGKYPTYPAGAQEWRNLTKKNMAPYYKPIYPKVYFPLDVQEKLDSLSTSLIDYIGQHEAKFITGDEPLSNFDDFVKRLEVLGIREVETIYNDAYQSYLKSLK